MAVHLIEEIQHDYTMDAGTGVWSVTLSPYCPLHQTV